MNLTEEQLSAIEEYSGTLHLPREIGYMIGLSGHELELFVYKCHDQESQLGELYHVSRLKELAIIRKSLMASAQSGNPEAIKSISELILNQEFDAAG
jgi:hypothetical protein